MTREEALLEASRIVAEAINTKDRLVREVIADHLIRLTTLESDISSMANSPRLLRGDEL
jgi:hypothetical protein